MISDDVWANITAGSTETVGLSSQIPAIWVIRLCPEETETLMVICKSHFMCLSGISPCPAFISLHFLYFVSLCCVFGLLSFVFFNFTFYSLSFSLFLLLSFLFLSWPAFPCYIFSSPTSCPAISSPLTEMGQESVPASTHNATVVVSAAGVMPYLQSRAGAGEQNSTLSISTNPSASSSTSSSSSTSCDRQPAPPGTMVSSQLAGQSYSLGISNSGHGPPPPKPPGGVYTSTGQHSSSDGCPLTNMVSTVNKISPPPLHFTLFLSLRGLCVLLSACSSRWWAENW